MLKKLWCNMMVADVNKAIEFYADVLGFQHVMSVLMGSEEVLFQHDRNKVLVYALIKNGDIELMLQEQKSLRENIPRLCGFRRHQQQCRAVFRGRRFGNARCSTEDAM